MVESNSKPRVFVGCSTESLEIGYCVQEELEYDTEVTLWQQGVMSPSGFTVDDLITSLGTFDFAIFIVTPDDTIKRRGNESFSMRDNVIFELGLFIAHLGRSRCFLIGPRVPPVSLPSDLTGLSPLTFDPNRSDGNLRASLGAACSRVRRAIKTQGIAFPRQVPTSVASSTKKGVTKEQRIAIESALQIIVDTENGQNRQPCLLFLDLDRFDAVNKWYGRDVCDEVIAVIEDTIRKSVPGQFATRIGGDQFLVCLKETTLAKAMNDGKGLTETVLYRPWNWISPNLYITVSAGVAQAKAGEEIDQWIVRAIHGAVNAKKAGGNQVQEGPIALPRNFMARYENMLS